MKLKALALSIALAAGVFAANAQTATKGNDVFVGLGGGIISTLNEGFNTPAFYGNIMVGRYITPVWGVRAVIGGPFQTLDQKAGNAQNYQTVGTPYSKQNKLFGELNADVLLNISNIFADDLAKFDVYAFLGPTMNFSSVGTQFAPQANQNSTAVRVEEPNPDPLKVRVGATAGLGLGYNITNEWELALEGRFGVTPSVFGDASQYRKGEGTGRLTLNGRQYGESVSSTYTYTLVSYDKGALPDRRRQGRSRAGGHDRPPEGHPRL